MLHALYCKQWIWWRNLVREDDLEMHQVGEGWGRISHLKFRRQKGWIIVPYLSRIIQKRWIPLRIGYSLSNLPCFPGNRRIKFEEFLSIFLTEKQKSKPVTAQQFIETLSVFDKDNAGRVASGEMRHVLTALGKMIASWRSNLSAVHLLSRTKV